jgi:hypothetical protein
MNRKLATLAMLAIAWVPLVHAAAPATPTSPSPGSSSSPGPTLGSTSITLSWNASSGATYYDVGVRDVGTGQLVVDTTTSSTSYAASLSAGKQYRWNVAACNSSGCSSFTTALYFQTTGSAQSPSISNVSPSSMPASNSNQTLTINGSNFQSGATLIFDPPTGSNINSTASKLTLVSSSQLSYQLNNASDAGTWTVTVRNPDGQVSTPASFLVEAAPAAKPVIYNVSPDPVMGANNVQPFTINGSGFVSGADITLKDIDKNETFPSRIPVSLSTTQIVLSTNFTSAASNWSVEVINPDGQSSGAHNFNVLAEKRPDLIIDEGSIVFTPTAVLAGQQMSMVFRVRNVGTLTAPATQARLRLSADTLLQSTDPGLIPLDVNVSSLSPGQSKDITVTTTVPAGTPAGAYYVGVFADWDNSANQSDVTNDARISTSLLTVSSPGTLPPVIQSFNSSQTIKRGESAVLEVAATGAKPLAYKWLHDGYLIEGANSKSVTVGAPGEYTVEVSNAGGVTTTGPMTLTVIASGSPSEPSAVPGFGQLIETAPFNPAANTIVITHGWQPGEASSCTADRHCPRPEWQDSMVWAIAEKFISMNLTRPNVFLYVWPEAFTGGTGILDAFAPFWLGFAAERAPDHGISLANELNGVLGRDYNGRIHFIGHSLGTIVNAYAANVLGKAQTKYQVAQMTILDAPMSPLIGPNAFSQLSFESLLEPLNGKIWVDNYIGTEKVSLPPAVGGRLRWAAPKGGLKVRANHSGVHAYYLSTIQGLNPGGFNWSTTLETLQFQPGAIPNPRPFPTVWGPTASYVSPTLALPEWLDKGDGGFRTVLGDAGAVAQDVNGQMRNSIRISTPPVILSRSNSSRMLILSKILGMILPSANATDLDESDSGQDSIIATNIIIPRKATHLDFDFHFSEPGDGDWLSVTFNDVRLVSVIGKSTIDGEFQNVRVPIRSFTNKTGVLKITLHGTGVESAQVSISNMRFVTISKKKPKAKKIKR